MNQITLKLAGTFISEAFQQVNDDTIAKCFRRGIGLEMFLPKITEEDLFESGILDLQSQMLRFTHQRVDIDAVLDYANVESILVANLTEDESLESIDEEGIIKADPSLMLRYALLIRKYFRNTSALQGAEHMEEAIKTLRIHLNYE